VALAPPGNAPPHFGFLGNKWGWKASELWQRTIHGPYRTVAVKAHGMELDSLDFLTNFSKTLCRPRIPPVIGSGFQRLREPLDKLLKLPDTEEVSTLNVTSREGNQAEISVQDQIPIGFSNQVVSVGCGSIFWMNRAQKTLCG